MNSAQPGLGMPTAAPVAAGGRALGRALAWGVLVALPLLVAGCSSSGSGSATGGTPTGVTATTGAGGHHGEGSGKTVYAITVTSAGVVDPAAVPLGDGYLSSSPKLGYVDSCTTPQGGGGANGATPWINSKRKTWDSFTKPYVHGSVSWPSAVFTVKVSGDKRVIHTLDLPVGHTTGIFPIEKSDIAYKYDQNPNKIEAHSLTFSLPLNPVAAAKSSCLPLGAIGVLTDGVILYDALDGEGRDAAAHEILDACGEHPDSSDILHHHMVPPCLYDKDKGDSILVGYALDGYGIYLEPNAAGQLLGNASLDACHGRTSKVLWNGKEQVVYHYDATLEYPYTLGCYHGTSITLSIAASGGGPAGGGPPGGGGPPPSQ